MKLWVIMLSLALAVASLCAWDCIHTTKIFNHAEAKSEHIYHSLLISDISNEEIQKEIL